MTTQTRWKARTLYAAMSFSVWLYRRSGGAIGGTIDDAPVLLLTTTGRRTGRVRTRPVVYGRDGLRLVVIAAGGGSDEHPAWWLNLRDTGHGTVQVDREVFDVVPHEATGRERERLWDKMVEIYPEYFNYATRTTRQLPVVVLERV